MNITLNKCDLCLTEKRGDEGRRWSDAIAPIHLYLKDHPALQCEFKIEVCTDCGIQIRDCIAKKIESLKIKDNKK